MEKDLSRLEKDIKKAESIEDSLELARFHHDVIISDMESVRESVDSLEVMIPSDIWPYPTYGEILYSVK